LQFLYCLNKGLSFLHIFRSNGMIFRNTLLKTYFESALIPLSLKGKRLESGTMYCDIAPRFHYSRIEHNFDNTGSVPEYLVFGVGTRYRVPAAGD